MKTLKQTSDANDISLTSSGDIAMSDGLEAYATILADAVRTVLGELQLNVTAGIDYFGTVFNGMNWIPRWKSEVRDVIMSYDFVNTVGKIEAEVTNGSRLMKYSVEVETDLGTITITQ